MITFHAVSLLLVAFSPLTLLLLRPGPDASIGTPFLERLVYVVPFLVVGAIGSALLSINGTLVAEWVIPALVILVAALITPSTSLLRTFSAIIFIVCISLCVEGLWLRESGYTSSPTLTTRSNKFRSRAMLNSVRAKAQSPNGRPVVLTQPLNEGFDQDFPNIETVVSREWHTPITGLFKTTSIQQNQNLLSK